MKADCEHTTSLMEIRRFLEAEKAAPPPWAAPQSNVEALYALLEEKRDDDLFWHRLRSLVQRIEDSRVDLVRLGFCEALGYSTVEKMLADLRADLRVGRDATSKPWKQAIASSLRATALAGFLLLGVASAACDDELCDEADYAGISGEDGQTYCELVDIIESSSLSSGDKRDMLDCLPELDASYREQLLATFQRLDDGEVASELRDVLESDTCYYYDPYEDDDGGH